MPIPSTRGYRITALRPLLQPYVGPHEPLQPGPPLSAHDEYNAIEDMIAGILPNGGSLPPEAATYEVIAQDVPGHDPYNAVVRADNGDGTFRDYLARIEEAHVWAEVYDSTSAINDGYGDPSWADDSPGRDGLAYPYEPMAAVIAVFVPRGAPLEEIIAATYRAAAHLPWPQGPNE